MQRYSKWIVHPARLLVWIACVAALAMVFHVTADILSKFLLNAPLEGTTETVAGYYMVIVVCFPMGYVTWTEGQIIVELFTRKLSGRRVAWLDSAVGIVSLVYMGILVWANGVESALRTVEGEVWDVGAGDLPIWPSRWILTIGLGLMLVYLILRLVRDLAKARSRRNV